MSRYIPGAGGLRDDELCNDRPCTCGAAIHDPAVHARIAKIFRAAAARAAAAEKGRTDE